MNDDFQIPSLRNKNEDYLKVVDSKWYSLILKICDEINHCTHSFFRDQGIKSVFLPITTGSISSPIGLSSDSLPVGIEIAGIKTYLADSMQFLLEYSCRLTEKGTYYIMPSFRGEQLDERHLNQFFHSEAEIKGELSDVITLVENYLKFLTTKLIEKMSDDIIPFSKSIDHMKKMVSLKSFPTISFEQALKLLYETEGAIKYREGYAFITNIGEKKLIEMHGGFVWVTHFKRLTVPFYQASCGMDSSNALCADLLFGIGEVVGAGERCLTGRDVCDSISSQGLDSNPYEWYIKMKDKYPIQTSGFGMGVERFLLWVLNHNDIRDTQLILRVNGEVQPL
ncbi:MAG: asparagine synthetase A [Firmicutes bacterium]|nr:asparagine synthetase A [Bacillota bacterium]